MKHIWIVLLCCALLLPLTGCGSLFDRSFSSVTTHQEQSASDEDASILRAENYADLVSCVQHFVALGQTSGTVHAYQYPGDIQADLAAACSEVLTEDPLGAYALADIDYSCGRIVSYYECVFSFTYRHTVEEMASIATAYGNGAIRDLLQSAMDAFEDTLVIRTSEFYAERNTLFALAQEAYYRDPGTSLGYPEITISTYPNTGSIRIVEFSLDYGASQALLQERAESVLAAAAQLVGQDAAGDETVAWLLYSRLLEQTQFDAGGSSSVYAALCSGSANSEGITLAYGLLCQQAGISCQLVQGTLNGSPHWWNLITLEDVCWQLDLTRADPEDGFLHNDEFMAAAGYNWSQEDYPACDGEDNTAQTVMGDIPGDGDPEAPAEGETPEESGSAADIPETEPEPDGSGAEDSAPDPEASGSGE